MVINHKKSGILTFHKKNKLNEKQHFQQFPIVENYKFLGITMDRHFKLQDHFKIIKKKTNYISMKIRWIPNSSCTFQDKLTL